MMKTVTNCFNCGGHSDHWHHVVPKALGGSETVPLCSVCHGKVHGVNFTDHRLLTRISLMKKAPEEAAHVLACLEVGCESCSDVASKFNDDGFSITPRRVRSLVYRMKKIPSDILVNECFGDLLGNDNLAGRCKSRLIEFIECGGLNSLPL